MDPVFLYPAAAAQMVMERRMETITNNIANAETTGFRRDIPIFATKIAPFAKMHSRGGVPDLTGASAMFPVPVLGGASDPTGGNSILPIPSYPLLDELVVDFRQGAVHVTGNPLDIAIDGKSFFQIQTVNGVRYTRNGSFRLSSEGQLVTQNGEPVLGEGGPIKLPQGFIMVDHEGKITMKGNDGGAPVGVDVFAMVDVADPSKMKKVGNNLFELVGEAATVSEMPHLHQGSLEASNVDPLYEMISMISAMRNYESVQKAIQGADDISLKNVNQVGQLKA